MRIAKRYGHEVEELEASRTSSYKPLAEREIVKPDPKNLTTSMKTQMDDILKRAGSKKFEGVGGGGLWGSLLKSDAFSKQLQFLEQHSRTGHFIEQYGTDGTYDGEFLYGMRHGKGTHEFRAEVYEGDWKWDHRHGWGTSKLADGSQIRGEWQSGKPHGYTTILDKDGNITYEGEFREGKRQGLGRQVFENGDIYDGGWKAGRLNDRGVYYFTNGDKLYGMWNSGVYDGIGVFRYADGSASRRVYKEGLLMSVQDYDASAHRFGKTLTRDGMARHTRDPSFPKDVFLLTST